MMRSGMKLLLRPWLRYGTAGEARLKQEPTVLLCMHYKKLHYNKPAGCLRVHLSTDNKNINSVLPVQVKSEGGIQLDEVTNYNAPAWQKGEIRSCLKPLLLNQSRFSVSPYYSND
jgi:hypothetical protein